ncbi:MAG: lipase maturation factor family protein [Deltaproteobacteria bacterium]|nr:lipase maturation factor family protein [Deltaproteobacteria bacterium]
MLGAIYAVAFASLAVQILGLVGERGILPVADYLEGVERVAGGQAVRLLPTLLWLSASDAALQLLSWSGFALSLLLMAGIAPVPVLALLWLFYLSLQVGGQVFLGYQWDTLLLETGLLALFFAPAGLWTRFAQERRASDVVRWLLWLLLFKLMFLSGITKLVSGDPTWANWTALLYHYETQPIPTPLSWYAHQLPEWLQRVSLGFMFAAELVAPFAIFAPPRWRAVRWAGCAVMVVFQLGIAATGNYGFFNWLTIALCLTLLDDPVWRSLAPPSLRRVLAAIPAPRPESRAGRSAAWAAAVVVLPLSTLAFAREIAFTAPREAGSARPLAGSDAWVAWAAPFRSVNGYGLFRVMTTERPEIAFEARALGGEWHELPFRWKAGDVARAPRFAAPHQPRLDWQMWFAALYPSGHRYWMLPLAGRILEGSPEVLGLLADDPFAALGGPPRELRIVAYQYRFTTPEEGRSGGENWWSRVRLGELTRPISKAAMP